MRKIFCLLMLSISMFMLGACDTDVTNDEKIVKPTAVMASETYKSYEFGEVASYTTRNFNKDGDVESIESYLAKNNSKTQTMFTRDKNSLIIDAVTKDNTGAYEQKSVSTLDEDGNETEILFYDEGELKYSTLREYENGNCISSVAYNFDGTEEMKILTAFDEENREISAAYYDGGELQFSTEKVYTENELRTNTLAADGNIISYEVEKTENLSNGNKKVTTTSYQDDDIAYSEEICIYDGENLMEKTYEEILGFSSCKYEYIYKNALLQSVNYSEGKCLDELGKTFELEKYTYDKNNNLILEINQNAEISYTYEGENLINKTSICGDEIEWSYDYTYFY